MKNNSAYSLKILRYLINLRIKIINFIKDLEFYIFHSVIDTKIKKFTEKIKNLNSIDSLINNHFRFIKEIVFSLGIREEKLNKTLFKVLNLIGNYSVLLNKLVLATNEEHENFEQLDSIFVDVYNFTESFNKKTLKFENIINKYKEKIK